MEEVKLILELLGTAGQLALWGLLAVYLYKAIVIGSIYGTVRYVITKVYHWKVHGKFSLREITLDDSTAQVLMSEVSRLSKSAYIRMADVDKLRKILDENL